MNDRILEICEQCGNKKTLAIKKIREEFGYGLVEAKQIVDDYAKGLTESQKSLNLNKFPIIISKNLTYKGGHPSMPKEKDCTITIGDSWITIKCGFVNNITISFDSISRIHLETADQIEKRITATRLLTLGVFALAFKKKKINTEKYFTIDFTINGIENTILINGKNAPYAHSETFKKYSQYLNSVSSTEPAITQHENTTLDPYEEIKKVKELLDMGIITQEEFEVKKKELLNL